MCSHVQFLRQTSGEPVQTEQLHHAQADHSEIIWDQHEVVLARYNADCTKENGPKLCSCMLHLLSYLNF